MTEIEFWTSLGLNIVGGIIAGLISGWMVTIYYREKDNSIEFKEFCKGFSLLLESVIRQLERGNVDVSTFEIVVQTLRNNKPRGEQKELLLMTEELLMEIHDYNNQINKDDTALKSILEKAEKLNDKALKLWQS